MTRANVLGKYWLTGVQRTARKLVWFFDPFRIRLAHGKADNFSPTRLECADEEVSINLRGLDRKQKSRKHCLGFCMCAQESGTGCSTETYGQVRATPFGDSQPMNDSVDDVSPTRAFSQWSPRRQACSLSALANGLLALGSQCTITPGNTVLGWCKHDELRRCRK